MAKNQESVDVTIQVKKIVKLNENKVYFQNSIKWSKLAGVTFANLSLWGIYRGNLDEILMRGNDQNDKCRALVQQFPMATFQIATQRARYRQARTRAHNSDRK